MNLQPIKATIIDDDAFRLLAYPFGGPIPHPDFPKGVDVDTQTFSERTDIKADWLPFRPTDWHHGNDDVPGRMAMGRTTIGKAIDLGRFDGPSSEPDEEGWWVTVWLNHGERRLAQIKRLAEEAMRTGKAAIFGSSEAPMGMGLIRTLKGEIVPWRRSIPGEIVSWPYWRQTLSTSPQNTHSVIRPLKATLDEIEMAGERPGPTFWADLEASLRSLAPSLRLPSETGAVEAKAGRVLSARNESDLRGALDEFRSALDRLDAVVRRQPDYTPKE